jgi:hypothetical protein
MGVAAFFYSLFTIKRRLRVRQASMTDSYNYGPDLAEDTRLQILALRF